MSYPEPLNPKIAMTADVYAAVYDFLCKYAIPDFPPENIFRGYVNRASMPSDSEEYAVMTIIGHARRGSNIHTFDTEDKADGEDGVWTSGELILCDVQVDFYSSDDRARLRAQMVETLSSDGTASQFFKNYNIACLFADDVRNLSAITDSEQYVQRYMTTLHLAYWSGISTEIPWFDTVIIKGKIVDNVLSPKRQEELNNKE